MGVVNKTCPLSDKDKLYVILHGECKHCNWFKPDDGCKDCPYIKALLSIPIIRKAIPNLIANDIFNVQPMTGPVGNVFKLKWVYKRKKNARKKLSTK